MSLCPIAKCDNVASWDGLCAGHDVEYRHALRASLAAERSRVNEAERERDAARKQAAENGKVATELFDSLKHVNGQLFEATRDLETRDAEVARLRDALAKSEANLLALTEGDAVGRRLPETLEDACDVCGVAADRYYPDGRRLCSDHVPATPEATTPAVPEPLRTLTPEELKHFKSISDEAIAEALEKGGRDRWAAEHPTMPAPAVPGRLAEALGLLVTEEAELLMRARDARKRGCAADVIATLDGKWVQAGRSVSLVRAFLAPQPEPSAPQTDSPTGGSVFPPEGLPGSTSVRAGLVDTSPSPVRREPGDLPPMPRCGRCGQPTSPCHPGIGYVPGTEPSASLGESGKDMGTLPSQHLPAERTETGPTCGHCKKPWPCGCPRGESILRALQSAWPGEVCGYCGRLITENHERHIAGACSP